MNISQLLEVLKDPQVSLSIGEKFLAGIFVATLSMIVVFIVLVIISAIISLLQIEKGNKNNINKNEVNDELKLDESVIEDNFEEVVAAITASICVSNGGKQISVRKVRRTNNTKSNWENMSKSITK